LAQVKQDADVRWEMGEKPKTGIAHRPSAILYSTLANLWS
jgi:hypothetical protein